MTVARTELEQYVVYAERLSNDLEVTIQDLEFRARGGKLHLVIDFSEVHSFLIPDQLDDNWLWPGLDEGMKAVVEHSALSEVMTGPPKPILLHPYLLEFQNFVTNLQLGIADKVVRELPAALQTLDQLMHAPAARALLSLANDVNTANRQLTDQELDSAVTFFEANARDLVSIVRGEVLEPLTRTRAFLDTDPFSSLDSIVRVQLTGREPEVNRRFQALRRLRGNEKDGASFIDALALEYVRQANLKLAHQQPDARVLLVSRSTKLHELVAEETREGLWPATSHGVLRHPRAFAALAWQVQRAAVDAIPQLTATRESLDLCRRSAAIRLKSSWSTLNRGRADTSLIEMVDGIKQRIISLVQMGGGVNESRVVTSRRRPNQNEVLQLLAMLLDRQEVFRAVANRMATLNAQLDREHEMVGVLLHTQDDLAKQIAVTSSSRAERVVLPRMGRLPYGLKFHTTTFLSWLDELQQRGEIRRTDLFDLFTRATSERADHYETLLFMAYILALAGQYALAEEYCQRALQSAEHHDRDDRVEATFFNAVCVRVLGRSPDRFEQALRSLATLRQSFPLDPRFVAEIGNILLTWWLRAREKDAGKWKATSPDIDTCLRSLEAAAELAQKDDRLRATVLNSLCYAYSHAFREMPTAEARERANTSLQQLISTLRALDPDIEGWPLRIKDTIAEATLLLNPKAFDRSFIEGVVSSMERDLASEAGSRDDRRQLQRRLNRFRRELSSMRDDRQRATTPSPL